MPGTRDFQSPSLHVSAITLPMFIISDIYYINKKFTITNQDMQTLYIFAHNQKVKKNIGFRSLKNVSMF